MAEAFKKLKLGEILYSDALNGENEDELQTQQLNPPPAILSNKPRQINLTDEQQEYALSTGQNPLATFRFERPPKFP